MTELAIVFLVNAVTSFLKGYVYPHFGKIGVHILIFAAALVGALYATYSEQFMSLRQILTEAIALFALSVSFYEVLLQYFPMFKQEQ